MTPIFLWLQMLATVQHPRQGARWIMGLRLSQDNAWTALMLMAVLGGGMGWLTIAVATQSQPTDPMTTVLFASPLQATVLQAIIEAGSAFLMFAVGRMFGGTGTLAEALALKAWMAAPLLVLQLVQLIGVLWSPPLYFAAGVAALGLNLWLLTFFVSELHGFRRTGLVVLGILGTSFLAGIPLVLLIAILGGGLPDV